MTTSVGKKRRRLGAVAALLCALVVSLAGAVAPAAAEEGDSAPIRPISEGGLSFPDITGPTVPEEFPYQFAHLDSGLAFRQVDDQTIVLEYTEYGVESLTIKAEQAHDADGAAVPTSIKLSEDEEGPVVTLIVHHRAGNPLAGGAPFVYPVSGGPGWPGGYRTITVELAEPHPPAVGAPAASPTPCTVPAVRGLSLNAARHRLRGAHCSLGKVRLATGVAADEGKVVKQFHAAGSELPRGAPVALKLGSG